MKLHPSPIARQLPQLFSWRSRLFSWRPRLILFCSLLVTLLLSACGTLEIGVASTEEAFSGLETLSTPEGIFDEPPFTVPVKSSFDNQVELVGYTLEPATAEPETPLTVTLIWRALAEVPVDYAVFVHLVDAEGQLLAQSDAEPAKGSRPTTGWTIGEYIIDQHQLTLPAGAMIEGLELQVGLYDAAEGQRLDIDSAEVAILRPELFASTGEPTVEATIVVTPEAVIETPTEVIEQATLSPQPSELRVAYTKDGDAWLWSQDTGPVALTSGGSVEDIWLSDDGQLVAFIRDQNIWVINSDGSGERQLTSQLDFGQLALGMEAAAQVLGIRPYQVAWLPGSHTLFFNTAPQLEGPGLYLSNDLWKLDAGSGELTLMLAPGDGGNFVLSPNGRRIAIITPGRIDLMNADGGNRREGLTHTPVITYSEFEYTASPVWSADSERLLVAIPPADRMAADKQPTSIWSISTDGRPARLLGHLTALPAPIFAPDFKQIVYLTGDTIPTGPDSPQPGLAIAMLDEDGVGESVDYPAEAQSLGKWSPDSAHFVYAPAGTTVPDRHIGALGSEPIAIGDGQGAAFDLRWIDANHYLYLQQAGSGWNILLSQLGDGEPILVDSIAGPSTAFDHAGLLSSAP